MFHRNTFSWGVNNFVRNPAAAYPHNRVKLRSYLINRKCIISWSGKIFQFSSNYEVLTQKLSTSLSQYLELRKVGYYRLKLSKWVANGILFFPAKLVGYPDFTGLGGFSWRFEYLRVFPKVLNGKEIFLLTKCSFMLILLFKNWSHS